MTYRDILPWGKESGSLYPHVFMCVCVCARTRALSGSIMSDSLWPHILILLFSGWIMSNSSETPWTIACQAPLSMGFSSQEYWSGLPFPSSGDLPDPWIKPTSPALAGRFLPLSHQGSPDNSLYLLYYVDWTRSAGSSKYTRLLGRIHAWERKGKKSCKLSGTCCLMEFLGV